MKQFANKLLPIKLKFKTIYCPIAIEKQTIFRQMGKFVFAGRKFFAHFCNVKKYLFHFVILYQYAHPIP